MQFMIASSSRVRGFVDGGAHLLIGAAAAGISDRAVDVGIGRLRLVIRLPGMSG